jgi:hypothetical protein
MLAAGSSIINSTKVKDAHFRNLGKKNFPRYIFMDADGVKHQREPRTPG